MGKVRKALRAELEASADERGFGKGWISGVLALALGLGGLAAVLFLKFPGLLSMPMLRDYYGMGEVRLALHAVLIGAFVLALSNLVLRRRRTMGLVAVTAVLVATLLGGSRVESEAGYDTGYYLGLDWFVINLTLLGALFIPLERIFGRLADQSVFRFEWREDLLYFLINSLLVQSLAFLSLAPATAVVTHTAWTELRAFMVSQPIWLQVIEIMVLTDLTQYWVHRVFHRLPFLWKFHAVHHSAQAMDWLAGSRMHLVEVVALRGLTVIPMYALGYGDIALKIYILYIYLHSTLIHANLRIDFGWLKKIIATPQFHHWHHAIEKEAIDVNFAANFPWLDRLFGTYYFPDKWPSGYGVGGHPVPPGYLRQFAYPFGGK